MTKDEITALFDRRLEAFNEHEAAALAEDYSDDAERATRSTANFLWTTFTRFDPAADISARAVELVHNHPAFTPPIVLDARMKPGYPEELFCDPHTAERVLRRWSEYFPAGGVEMGDSDRAHLD